MTSKPLANKPTALITGGAGGLALATTRHLVTNGWHVFAADCNEEALCKLTDIDNVTPVFMDVTETQSIKAAFEKIDKEVDSLNAVINFAAILRVGSMADMDEDMLKGLLDINVMGTFRVNQVFMPLLNRGTQKGRVINISSETGWQTASPFNGAYAMSKHAIEAYSDALRRELMFLDIPVIKIQPGPFKTEMVAGMENSFTQAADNSLYFKKQINTLKSMAVRISSKANNPEILAAAVYKALTAPKPKAAYSVKANPAVSLMEYLPLRWTEVMLKRTLNK